MLISNSLASVNLISSKSKALHIVDRKFPAFLGCGEVGIDMGMDQFLLSSANAVVA